MPELCRFYGVRIKMYYDDHDPPHFHAEYAGDEALLIRAQVGKLHFPYGEDRGMLPVGSIFRNPFTNQ
jgi:hypothetical protein